MFNPKNARKHINNHKTNKMNYHDNDPSYLKMKQLINRSDPGYLNIYRFRLAFSYLRKFNIIKSN